MCVYCRFCGKPLSYTFADLGLSPLANEYISQEDLSKGQRFFPLVVNVCSDCFLVQTKEFSKPEEIFSDYKYFSSFSSSWLQHCKEYVDMIVPQIQLTEESCVVEIACNDGYLLQYFKNYHIPVYGIEPAKNVAVEAEKKGIEVITEFFNDKLATKLVAQRGKANLIIGNNVLAHVPDIGSFVEGVHLLLDEQGIATFEFPHLLQLMKNVQFDTIYHEHFSYLSLLTVTRVFETHGLRIVDIDELNTHGGSIRVYAAQKESSHAASPSVQAVLQAERDFGLHDMQTYETFRNHCERIKRDSLQLLIQLKEEGKHIAAFGAAAKGNTFLNYCGIRTDMIDYVVDSNPAKQGLYLPGTLIPIVGKEKIWETKPDYILILPWNLRDEISELLKETRDWGCKFITCIPSVNIF